MSKLEDSNQRDDSAAEKVQSVGGVKRTKLVDLGSVDVETRGSAGGTPDWPSKGKDTPNTIGYVHLDSTK